MITLREKISQMLIMGFNGEAIDEASEVVQWLKEGLGGVLLFDRDVKTSKQKNLRNTAQIIHLTQELKRYSQTNIANLPLLICLDYEGGAVDRLKNIPDCFVTSPPADLLNFSPEAVAPYFTQMATTLKNLGFNLNFAPVVDLNLNNEQGIIGKLKRGFSQDYRQVIAMAHQFVTEFHAHGVFCCYKHFPGHGSAAGDTHHGFVDVTESFQDDELEPYYHLLKSSPECAVMTAHVINKKLDASGLPATLSFPILTTLLRQQMEFNGVIISDDMQMKAICDHFSLKEALCLAINAGSDMFIFANQLDYISAPAVIDAIEDLIKTNQVSIQKIEDSYQRINRFKIKHF